MLANQHGDGGWSSGAHGTDGSQAGSDVATTAYTTLALIREGGSSAGQAEAIRRGVDFVLKAVETAPPGPRLNTPQGTQIQYKMGELVDTHLASLLLTKVVGRFDRATNARVDTALDVVLSKVQAAQGADGSFDRNAWAPVLSTSVATQALNEAAKMGKSVDKDVLKKADDYQANLTGGGRVDASAGAGVPLYAVASSLASNAVMQERRGEYAAAPAAAAEARDAEVAARRAVAGDDGSLMAGFGSIGGEEMVSYAMISDTLAKDGKQEWTQWESRIGSYLVSIQNADGSWVGHHCITSRAFTTAGGLMTLTADAVRQSG
jgi:hypothetical protein